MGPVIGEKQGETNYSEGVQKHATERFCSPSEGTNEEDQKTKRRKGLLFSLATINTKIPPRTPDIALRQFPDVTLWWENFMQLVTENIILGFRGSVGKEDGPEQVFTDHNSLGNLLKFLRIEFHPRENSAKLFSSPSLMCFRKISGEVASRSDHKRIHEILFQLQRGLKSLVWIWATFAHHSYLL